MTTRTPRGEDLARTTDAAGALGAGLEETAIPGGPRRDLDLAATTAPTPPIPTLETAAGTDSTLTAAPELARGAVVGRYVVVDRLGAGAMGVVYAAFDPELDRKVALKLLHPGGGDSFSPSADGRVRLFREAQALAKLSHPNVVGVFDVGAHGDQVWVAMELVDGVTLRAWIAERPRDWIEVLAIVQAAGRGLAAAHAAGLVHRDIKPDNIMIGADGRARVMDFGLARSHAALDPAVLLTSAYGQIQASDLTHAGSLVGTPAYMAPEQFRGGEVGPAADLFAFCVTVWECLHGARPFSGKTLPELRANVESMRVQRPADRRAPRRLDAVLLRGLAAAPRDRWPDMPQLLAALEQVQVGVRRRRSLLFVGGALAFAGALAGGATVAEQRKIAACEAAGAAIDVDWSPAVRADLARAFAATGKANADTILERTAPWLDRWALAWRRAQAQVCLAAEVVGTLEPVLHARAQDCLDERRGSFTALLDQLAHADELTLTRATTAAAALPVVDECTDPEILRQRAPISPQLRVAALRSRRLEAHAASLSGAGKFREARRVAGQLVSMARAAGDPSLLADAEYRLGHAESQLGEYAAAEASLTRALAAAREGHAPRVAAAALIQLVWVVGDRSTRFAEGKVWAEAARTELAHVAGETRHLEAQLDNNLGLVFYTKGDQAGALRLHERALAGWQAVFGPQHPQVGLSLNNLANTVKARGDRLQALDLYKRALSVRERALGSDHPGVAGTLANLGNLYAELGAHDESLRLHQRALEIRERVLGPGHPDLAESLIGLANIHYAHRDLDPALALYQRALVVSGDNLPLRATAHYNCGNIHDAKCRDQDALRELTRALAIFESTLGKQHATLAYPLGGLASVRMRLGEFDEAHRVAARALAVREAALGPTSPGLVPGLLALAAIERARGRLDDALRLNDRALALAEAAKSPDPTALAKALGDRASVLSALRRHAEAIAAGERALAAVPPGDRGDVSGQVRFALARALWDGGGDRRRARALAERVLAEQASVPCGRKVDDVRAWLAAHDL